MRTLSRTSSAVSDDNQPDLSSARPTVKPGVPFSTMNIDMPWRALVVFAARKYRSAWTPLVMKSLVPFSTQWSPSRRAVVRIPATSEPAPGSVMPTAVIVRPAVMPGMYAAFWRPPADLAKRVATVRVLHEVDGRRQVVSHFNKATKGSIVRDLLEDGRDPRTPTRLADVLTDLGWTVEVGEPTPKGTQLDVVVSAV